MDSTQLTVDLLNPTTNLPTSINPSPPTVALPDYRPDMNSGWIVKPIVGRESKRYWAVIGVGRKFVLLELSLVQFASSHHQRDMQVS